MKTNTTYPKLIDSFIRNGVKDQNTQLLLTDIIENFKPTKRSELINILMMQGLDYINTKDYASAIYCSSIILSALEDEKSFKLQWDEYVVTKELLDFLNITQNIEKSLMRKVNTKHLFLALVLSFLLAIFTYNFISKDLLYLVLGVGAFNIFYFAYYIIIIRNRNKINFSKEIIKKSDKRIIRFVKNILNPKLYE